MAGTKAKAAAPKVTATPKGFHEEFTVRTDDPELNTSYVTYASYDAAVAAGASWVDGEDNEATYFVIGKRYVKDKD